MAFAKAVRHAAKLRMALHGPAGSGKTKTALLVASGLGGRIAVLDTENGSASRYAGEDEVPDFDVDECRPPYLHTRVTRAIREATAGGYGVLIIDSLTAFWKGEGGIMSAVDDAADKQSARGGKRDTFGAWREGDRLYREMMDAIQGSPIHIIATMRSKMAYEKDESSKKIQKIGYAPEMRDGAEYEFDIEAALTMEHALSVGKTRVSALDGKLIKLPGRSLGEGLARWLDGAPPPPRLAAVPESRPTPKSAPAPDSGTREADDVDARLDTIKFDLDACTDAAEVAILLAKLVEIKLPKTHPRRAEMMSAYAAAQSRTKPAPVPVEVERQPGEEG